MEDNEHISAFAFKTGRMIEDLINKETNNLKEQNQLLQAKILEFYSRLEDRSYKMDGKAIVYKHISEDYKEHFNIETKRHGKIED